MNFKKITLSLLLLVVANSFSQNIYKNLEKPQSNVAYLDSIKNTFLSDNLASCVDSLWLKELTNLDLYNDLEKDIKTINLDDKVDYELPTSLLKERLAAMDSKSPFNIEYNQGLENIIKSFLKNRKKSFERLMAISEYYFPIFEEALAKQKVPLEIKYLAVVESALNPRAVSRMGATGLWQFMYQTGKQYNLNIDSYVDDRSDPLKSSAAAAQYMTNMYKIFGDWDLVLASYNSGPGNVAKAIRRSGGQQNYWNIRKNLPKETQGYVPAFLATMYIYEYHNEHGITPKRAVVKQFATDTVMIRKKMSFKQIADLLDMPVAQLQLLNPQYKLNVVPAYTDKKHFLTLPSDKIAVFTSNEDKIYAYVDYLMNQREKPYTRQHEAIASRSSVSEDVNTVTNTKVYKVKKGDNLSEIADRYNVSIADIKSWNRLKSNKINLGANLKIVNTEQIASKDKNEEKEGIVVVKNTDLVSVSNSKTATQSKSKESIDTDEVKGYKYEKVVTFKDVTKIHKVKSGDNLSEISNKYGVTIAEIKKWNNLKNNNVQLGNNLKIISNEKVVTTVKKLVKSESIASNEKTKKEQLAANEDKLEDIYVVQQGDNLSAIARKFNVSVEDLKKWNDITDNNIQLESKLKIGDIIKDDVAQATIKTEIKNVEYIVQKGDNLGSIAKKNNVAVSDIKIWNDLSDDVIQLGDKVIVGKKLILDPNQTVAEKATKKEKVSKNQREDHYYVQKGDSLFSIAKKYPGISISDIKKWNGISGNELKPGMKLKING